MENKRKNIYIIIFIITTIVASCVAVYFCVIGNNKVNELQLKVDELIAKNKNQVEKEETILDDNNKDAVEEKIVEKVVEKSIIPKYDPSKMKNKPDNIEYSYNIMYSGTINNLSFGIDSNGIATINVYYDGENRKIQLNGINEKIINIYQGTLGDGAVDCMIFLTESGNVYWADNISTAINKYQGIGVINAEKVNKVSNICKVVWTMSQRNNSQAKARATFVAIDINGDCYDLWYEHRGVQ